MTNTIVIRLSALGDVAILIPVLYSVANRYPEDRFMMVTKSQFAGIFVNKPANLRIIPIDTKLKHKGIAGLMRFVKELKQKTDKSDAIRIADMHGLLRSSAIRLYFSITGAETAEIDKGRVEKERLTRTENKILTPLKTSLERYQEVFEKIGYNAEIDFQPFFRRKNKNAETRIGIAPFAKYRGKTYPIEKMQEVLKQLSERQNTHIYLFGGKAEAHQLSAWAKKYPNMETVAGGKMSFPEELHLMSEMDIMLTMDSANMHLASLVGTPVVSVWGATHPFAGFYGFRQDLSNVIQLDLPCRPCSVFGSKPCLRGDYVCLNGISPEMITDKLENVLAAKTLI